MSEIKDTEIAAALTEAADRITAFMRNDEKAEAKDLLSSFSVNNIREILKEIDPELRVETVLSLDRELAHQIVTEHDEDPENSFFREISGSGTSHMLETIYDDDDDNLTAVADLPPFVVQRLLAHGTERIRTIIEQSMAHLMESKQLLLLRSVLLELNPVDIAAILDDFKTDDLLKIYRILPKDMATDVFVYLPPEVSQNMLTALSESEAGRLIDDLYADDAADILEEMPSTVVKKLLSQTSAETRSAVNHLLRYKEDSAGSIMTVEFVDLKEYYTVEQAIEAIRKNGIDKETINNCYVLDAERKLLGMITLRKLLLSKPLEKIGDLMEENVIIVRTNTDQEEVARLFKKYDFTTMPVCDSETRLVGIVTVDDIVDIIQEEAEEDFSKMAAMAPIEDTYLKTSVWTQAKGRILWLLFLMISATFTGMVINAFESDLTTFLYSFTPLLMGTAGNCGSQASTTVIRALALNQISTKDYLKVSWKEARISIICSSILAVANAVRVMLMYAWNSEINQDFAVIKIAVILGLSLIFIILIAQTLGSLLPIIAKKMHVDPALMSAPVISTIMDTLSILIYCAIIIITGNAFGWIF